MEFNPSKCTVIHVTRSKSIVPSQYTLYGHVLDSVSSSKYLGVTLNDHLTWSDHIQNTVTSANKTLQGGTSFVDLLCFCSVLCLLCLCASVYMCFVVTCWERADLLALVCGVFCEFVTFPLVSWVGCGT